MKCYENKFYAAPDLILSFFFFLAQYTGQTFLNNNSTVEAEAISTQYFKLSLSLFVLVIYFSVSPSSPPLSSFSKTCTFLCENMQWGNACYKLSPCLADPPICWAFFIFLFMETDSVVDLGGEREKVALADNQQSIFSITEQQHSSFNPCLSEAETPKSLTQCKLNRLVLPIVFISEYFWGTL